jgi:hypothetical protein
MAGNDREADSFALLAALGGLHLHPPNAQQFPDLKTAAVRAASAEPQAGAAASPARLERLLAEEPVHRPLPHQVPCPFTSSLVYLSGSHTVMAGWEEDSDWTLSRVLLATEAIGGPLRDWARTLAPAVFAICDTIAARASLERHMEAVVRPMQPTEVPGYTRLKALSAAVELSPEDLAAIAGREWETTLAPLICSLPLAIPSDEDGEPRYEDSELTWRPLVRARDGGVIVSLPGDLLVALRHAIVCRALELGNGTELEEQFNSGVVADVLRSLASLGHLAGAPAPEAADPFPQAAVLLPMDTDKLLHLMVLGEDISTYDRDNPRAECRALPSREQIEARLTEVEAELLNRSEPPNEVLHLIVVQTMGRPFTFTVANPQPPLMFPRLVFSAPELKVIATLEEPDLLLLWRFGRAIARLRSSVALMPISQLDEFAAWRSSDFSFDDVALKAAPAEQAEPVVLLPGSALALREEVVQRFDFHGVLGPGGGMVEVERMLEDEEIDLYGYRGRLSRPDLRTGAYGPGGVWVVIENGEEDPRAWDGERKWTELIAYWLWKLRPSLAGLAEALEGQPTPTVVAVELVDDRTEPGAAPFAVENDGDRRVAVRFSLPAAEEAFGGRGNETERSLISAVLAALATAVGCADLDADAARRVCDEGMPPEVRKLIFARHADPAAREVRAARRMLSRAEIDVVMHRLGRELADDLDLVPGPVPAEQLHDVLNTAVSLMFGRLEQEVAALQGERLQEWLIDANEALVRHGVSRGMELAGEVACYGAEAEAVNRRRAQTAALSSTSVANRFLIEYVAARPPQGLRPISFSAYETLLAVAYEIVELGTLSDLLNYELASVEAFLSPTGRFIATAGSDHHAAQQIFAGQVASGDVPRSLAQLEGLLASEEEEGEEEEGSWDAALDRGFEAEYGFSFEAAVSGLYGLCELGIDSPASVTLSGEEATETIAGELGGDTVRAKRIVDVFSLSPRPGFFPPPPGFNKEELYPWRFNRRLSYLRRPLIEHQGKITYGPAGLFRSIEYMVNSIPQGRLRASSPELKEVISKIQSERGNEFNDRLASLYGQRAGLWVRARVEKLGSLRIEREPGQPLGDIDVLVIAPAERRIIAIEAKALAVALTPQQLRNEIQETFDPDQPSALTRHRERCEWLEQHRQEILRHAKLDTEGWEDWTVEPLIAVDEEVLSPLIRKSELPIRAWQQLVKIVAEGRLY